MAARAETNPAGAYGRWAPIYDFVFGPVFKQGRRAAVKAAERVGGRILEVGVGTGISLPSYSDRNVITAVDISEPMLAKARRRVSNLNLAHVEGIDVMDAENLTYSDGAFDVAVAQYVITSCPNPEKALDELARVTRPGGEIVITTRVGAEGGVRAGIEKVLMPVTTRLGFRTQFDFSRYTDWARKNGTVKLVENSPIPPLGHFSLLRFRKFGGARPSAKAPAGAAAKAPAKTESPKRAAAKPAAAPQHNNARKSPVAAKEKK